ncbi:Gfo/Idh/MocA family oxidoreductase [Streptomyces sp. NPDC048419]|uniref:Gfo/Idh/MocA family oxidoreductase n=1 Tax=Streptomyces sp. NPDC048419 TaxID=3365547 RepID=UPI0037231C4A
MSPIAPSASRARTLLQAGCRVVTEKPMIVDAERCTRILDAVNQTGNSLTVAFNYRFNPVHERFGSHRETTRWPGAPRGRG